MAEEADLDDRTLKGLLERLGHVWPATDSQLDAWLSANPLAPAEAAWVRDVVRKRIEEARGASAAPPRIAPPVVAAVAKAERAAKPAKASPRRLSFDDLATLNKELLELVAARVPLPSGLAAWASELRTGALAGVLDHLRADLDEGLTLSDAIARRGDALPPIYRSLVEAGEASGDLASVLALLTEQAEADAEIAQRTREALAYPAVTLVAAVATCGALLVYVVPQFRNIFDSMSIELPWITSAWLGLGETIQASGVVGVVALLAASVGAWFAFRRWGSRFARKLVFRSAGSRRLAELSRALSGFLRRGVPADKAFRALAGAYADGFPKGSLEGVVDRLESGSTLAAALRPEKTFPTTFVWLVGTAEERGTLPETLGDLAAHYERVFRRRLRLIETMVAPVALLVVGFFVASGVLSIFLPIFKLQQALSQ